MIKNFVNYDASIEVVSTEIVDDKIIAEVKFWVCTWVKSDSPEGLKYLASEGTTKIELKPLNQ